MEYIFGLRFSTYILERFVEMENGGKRQQKKKKNKDKNKRQR